MDMGPTTQLRARERLYALLARCASAIRRCRLKTVPAAATARRGPAAVHRQRLDGRRDGTVLARASQSRGARHIFPPRTCLVRDERRVQSIRTAATARWNSGAVCRMLGLTWRSTSSTTRISMRSPRKWRRRRPSAAPCLRRIVHADGSGRRTQRGIRRDAAVLAGREESAVFCTRATASTGSRSG